jgi:hypothetical protein
MTTLRPPLPPPLSHEEIFFVAAPPAAEVPALLSPDVVAAIGAALTALLPPGDITVGSNGYASGIARRVPSTWETKALHESIEQRLLGQKLL